MKIETLRIKSESLKGNRLNDPAERDITVIQYNLNKNTPVLIGLAGFFGSNVSFMNRSYSSMDFPTVLKRIIDHKLLDSFLIVLPDTMTSLGGNQYLNSPSVGNYEDFITRELVSVLNERFGQRKIGLFGKSSGGFGAYTLVSRHPDQFDGFIDVSGDSGFEYCYLRDMATAITTLNKEPMDEIIRKFRSGAVLNREELDTMNIIAMSAFYSPSDNCKFGIELPFDTSSGEFLDSVWKKWNEFDPVRNIDSYAGNLKGKKIILQVGSKDEFSMNIGINTLSKKMKNNGIDHKIDIYDSGHFSLDYTYLDSIPEMNRRLSQD